MDLLETPCCPDFDMIDYGALEESICLELTLPVYTIVAICEPIEEFYRVSSRDQLYDCDDIILRKTIRRIPLSICRYEFQLTTLCSQLIFLFFESCFHDAPILSRISALSQYRDNIHDRVPPFGIGIIPYCSDFSIIKKTNGNLWGHSA